jgi:hypothetical protein
MSDSISIIETDLINKKIEIIQRQTDYTIEIAREKLEEFNYDEIKVIKHYFGIPEKKQEPIKSLNQEIYRQLRGKLDGVMRDYTTRVENGETKKHVIS